MKLQLIDEISRAIQIARGRQVIPMRKRSGALTVSSEIGPDDRIPAATRYKFYLELGAVMVVNADQPGQAHIMARERASRMIIQRLYGQISNRLADIIDLAYEEGFEPGSELVQELKVLIAALNGDDIQVDEKAFPRR